MSTLHSDARATAPGTPIAHRLKVITMLNADELLAVPALEGRPRVTLRIRLPHRTGTADIAAKSLRKAQWAIREAGADNIALVLQGRLTASDVVAEAGLPAQPKAGRTDARPVITHRHGGEMRARRERRKALFSLSSR